MHRAAWGGCATAADAWRTGCGLRAGIDLLLEGVEVNVVVVIIQQRPVRLRQFHSGRRHRPAAARARAGIPGRVRLQPSLHRHTPVSSSSGTAYPAAHSGRWTRNTLRAGHWKLGAGMRPLQSANAWASTARCPRNALMLRIQDSVLCLYAPAYRAVFSFVLCLYVR